MDERRRIREALLDLCLEQGLPEVTVAALCERAEVDRSTFEDMFTDLENCVVQIYLGEHERYRRQLASALEGTSSWRDRLRATAYTIHRYIAEDARVWKFVVVEVRIAGERSQLAQGAHIEALLELVDEGRREPGAPASLTRATSESVVGGIFNQIFTTVGTGGPLPPEQDIVRHMMFTAVLPYVGPEVANEELTFPAPPLRSS
jgi:AcrR family transcriptional regulator